MMIRGGRKFGRIAFSVSFLWFLLLVSLADCKRRGDAIASGSSSKSFTSVEGETRSLHQKFDVNYVSKRRVPNGPDPIHNRGRGTSRLPPT